MYGSLKLVETRSVEFKKTYKQVWEKFEKVKKSSLNTPRTNWEPQRISSLSTVLWQGSNAVQKV